MALDTGGSSATEINELEISSVEMLELIYQVLQQILFQLELITGVSTGVTGEES